MKSIIGLGNPGKEYQQSRHNVGFMVLDNLVGQKSWTKSKSANLVYSWIAISGQKIELVKPQTFMNNSGEAVKGVMTKHPKLSLENVYIVLDDLDLELGNYKIQFGKGPKAHHGLLSIYKHLKTKKFWHVRIGVDARAGDRNMPADKYVLGRFSDQEQQIIKKVVGEVSKKLLTEIISPQ